MISVPKLNEVVDRYVEDASDRGCPVGSRDLVQIRRVGTLVDGTPVVVLTHEHDGTMLTGVVFYLNEAGEIV